MTPKERAAMQQALESIGNTVNQAIATIREALDNSLKPKCFADYQPNHTIDRACAYCAVATVCQTGEQAEQQSSVAATATELLEPVALAQDEIFRMAREAGGFRGELPKGYAWMFFEDAYIERFATLVAAHAKAEEREIEDYIETNKALVKEIIDLKKREWVEPSDEQISKITRAIENAPVSMTIEDWKRSFARAVLKLAKELNT